MHNNTRNAKHKVISLFLAISVLLTVFAVFPTTILAADPDYTFSEGAVLIDSSYSGKNILIKNGVFSVAVSGAVNVNIIFESVTMDRRYSSDSNGTISGLYDVAVALGWRSGTSYTTYKAQTCPLYIENNSSVTVAFRGVNNFYAGTNGCTVNSSGVYTKSQSGGGFAGIQVESGSSLTIAPSGGTINAYGAFYVSGDNSENSSYKYSSPSGTTQNALSGGAGIGGGAAWNTTTSASSSYTAGTPGTIIINGGNVNAYGGHQAAGIGGGLNGAATTSSITINGGNVKSYGGRWAAGIGDGDSLQDNWASLCEKHYSVVINGGTVTAIGGVACPGIGTTDELSSGQIRNGTSGMKIDIVGGTVTAMSGYPDGFNPAGSAGYSGTDAAAAIGAGNKTNMESNSISVASAARIIASGFGHYSVTENGTSYDAAPTVNIDSDGYMFLGRFPELASALGRTFELFEAQRFEIKIDTFTYEYIKYITQPSDGTNGEIYYYCPEAPDNKWLLKAGSDGTIENASVVELDTADALEKKLDSLTLTLYTDDSSAKIHEIDAPAHFRSIALSLPNPKEHGGIYALKIPTDSMYGYTGTATLPKSGFATITIGAQEQGTISGKVNYPSRFNIVKDSISESFTDMDVYRNELFTDGRDGLIGNQFMPNVFAYKIYIEHDDDIAYIFAKYSKGENIKATIEAFNTSVTETDSGTDIIVSGSVDMTGVSEKVVRIKKTDTVIVDGKSVVLNSVVYKITIIKKAVYNIALNPLDKVYDGNTVNPSIIRLEATDGSDTLIGTDVSFATATYTYYIQNDDGEWVLEDSAPKNAGKYKVSAEIRTATYTAFGEATFTISKCKITVSRIQNPLVYVSATDHVTWIAPHRITNPGKIYFSGIIGSDDVYATISDVFYNDISVGYSENKITLTGITLNGTDCGNYETDETQTVFGQINYSLDKSIFRKKPASVWDKFYPVDSPLPVKPGTADYHSPSNGGVYDTHGDYVYARTEGEGENQNIYAADIEFGSMYFSYSKSQWNADDMIYEELEGESRWTGFDGNNNMVKVINRSNTQIYYAANCKIDFLHSAIGDSTVGIRTDFYAQNSASGLPITGIKQIIPAAVAGDFNNFGTPSSKMCYIILSGVPQLSDSDRFTVVGSITVTISDAE